MTLQPRDWTIIPEQTAQIARAAFPKGNIYMMMPDELGVLYSDSDFVTLSLFCHSPEKENSKQAKLSRSVKGFKLIHCID